MSEGPFMGDATLSAELARRVNQVCDRFEAAWKAGQRPRIEEYLGADSATGPDCLALLRELIVLDVAYRQRGGESPRPEDYQARFPSVHQDWLINLITAKSPLGLRAGAILASRYEILHEVDRGAMGAVYRARHRTLDMQVAIKVILPGASSERFLREARLLGKINSPYVVAVHDFDLVHDGYPIIVMEWVEGSDLLKTMKAQGGPLPEERALPWMRQTSEGMLAAANQGIIHRDLKPSNILIDAAGRARVADFGLARSVTSLAELSQSVNMLGTPYYMAPEQAENPRGVDTRADIYSFGATFYHALTGVPPFDGETVFSILYKHKTEPLISPRARNPHLSERMSELLERCLAKSPHDRFPSFAEVLQNLHPAPGAPSPWEVSDDPELIPYLSRYQARRQVYLTGQLGLHEGDTYEFPRGQVLRILRGDLVHQDVDAIVSSDTNYLTMTYGLSEAIRLAAGPVIRQEAKRYVPVLPGRAVVTSGGDLRARFVFHSATIGKSFYQVVLPSRDLISEIMASCFYHADSLYVQSIAFPLLGTGGAGLSKTVCLDTMFQFLSRMLLRGLTVVRDARIILFP